VPFFLERAREAKTRVLAANVSKAGKPVFGPSVTRDAGGVRVAFVGAVEPHGAWQRAGYAVADPVPALKTAAVQARSSGAKIVVAVLHMPFARGQQIAGEIGADFALLAHDGRASFRAEPANSALVFGAGAQGRQVSVLELSGVGAPGVWKDTGETDRIDRDLAAVNAGIVSMEKRRGTLPLDKRGSLEESILDLRQRRSDLITRKAALDLQGATGRRFRLDPRTLGTEIANEPKMQALVDTFKHDLDQINARIAAQPQGEARFAGVKACATCHTAAFDVYKDTPHSIAWTTLVRETQDKNLNCVGCHSSGFRTPGGWNDPAQIGIHKDVNCESCHGPGLAHSRAPSKENIVRLMPEKACIACHDENQAEKFVDATYRPKILGPGHDVRRAEAEQGQ